MDPSCERLPTELRNTIIHVQAHAHFTQAVGLSVFIRGAGLCVALANAHK